MERDKIDKMTPSQVYRLMCEFALIEAIDMMIDEMVEYPQADAIMKRIKIINGRNQRGTM